MEIVFITSHYLDVTVNVLAIVLLMEKNVYILIISHNLFRHVLLQAPLLSTLKEIYNTTVKGVICLCLMIVGVEKGQWHRFRQTDFERLVHK